ncbi:MAG: ExeM/NucH family extracellular endonuclease [Endozoicomonas sp.]
MHETIRHPLAVAGLALAGSFITVSAQAALIISEYVEGSSYNKAIELFNTSTDQAVSLDDFQLKLFSNGNTSPNVTLQLSGSLAAGGTYVIVNSQAVTELKDKADIISGVANFNGDDAVQLQDAADNPLDTLGVVGERPNYGKDKTLARRAGSLTPSAMYQESQWLALDKDNFSGIGVAPGGGQGGNSGPVFASCDSDSTRVSELQGTGEASAVQGETHIVQGVVTRTLYNSYYLQQDETNEDLEGASRGILVFDKVNSPAEGDEVYLMGKVSEYKDLTQLQGINDNYIVCSSGQIVTPEPVNMPEDGNFEAYEGMLVDLAPMAGDDGFYVSETYTLNRYGDLMLSSGNNRIKPTNLYPAGSQEAVELQAKNDANKLIIDDADGRSYLPEISYLSDLSFENPVRVGSRVASGMNGIITEAFGSYRLIPTDALVIDNTASERVEYPDAPVEKPFRNNLRAASFNVLNYFNGMPATGGEIDWSKTELGGARGANNAEEFARQRAKIISALARIDADVVGLIEIENDGWDENSAIHDLVTGFNASSEKSADKTYAISATDETYIGSDVIKVALIYNSEVVEPVGAAQTITAYPFDEETAKHRPPVIQTFKDLRTGKQVTFVVNHFKSKGSACSSLADPVDADGQGNCNRMRVAAAETLGQYLEEHFVGQDVMILGDLNAYAQEDPLLVLTEDGSGREIEKVERDAAGQYSSSPVDFRLGYANALSSAPGSTESSPATYVFSGEAGTLDYALVSDSLLERVSQAFVWSVNAFELPGSDYNDEFFRSRDGSFAELKTTPDGERQWFEKLVDASSPFRSSDHDPVIVDIDMGAGSLGLPMAAIGLLALLQLRRRQRGH